MNALARLIEGHARFRKECFAAKKILMSTLATQQQPKTMVIACSDSRVDPAILFDCDREISLSFEMWQILCQLLIVKAE